MFKKNEGETNLKNAETIIGPSIRVKGNFAGQGNIIVEGILEGNIKTSNDLYVGNKARVIANVEAKQAKIGGEVHGNLKITGFLEISSSAKIFGDIEADSLFIEKGAIFNGRSIMSKEKEQEKPIKK